MTPSMIRQEGRADVTLVLGGLFLLLILILILIFISKLRDYD
jgi:hypothetical protein